MNVQTFKNVAAAMPPWVSMLLRADHGVGKSGIVRQVSAQIRRQLLERGVISSLNEYPVIDQRLSQKTEGDLVGLPILENDTTHFCPPDWYMQACKKPCALFLDELNRATPEVMQGAFQIVLDRELNGYKLHPETRVYAAINIAARYSVNEIDPALLDRFFAIDLEPTLEDFVAWARSTDPEQGGNLHPFVPDFIQSTNGPMGPTGSTLRRRSNPAR